MKSDYDKINRVAHVHLPRGEGEAVSITLQLSGPPTILYLTVEQAWNLADRLRKATNNAVEAIAKNANKQ